MQPLLPLLIVSLASCVNAPSTEAVAKAAEASPEQHPTQALPQQGCDTISFGNGFWRFIPLRCALRDAAIALEDKQLVYAALDQIGDPIDSIWTTLPEQHGRVQPIRADSTMIRVDLSFHIGIIEEMALERSGRMREGNWSGHDGTLVINKVTGTHRIEAWQ